MVRSRDVPDTLALQERVDRIAEGAALMTDTTFERIFVDGTADTLPNPPLEACLYANMQAVPLPGYTEAEWEYAAALRKTYASEGLPGLGAKRDSAIAETVKALSAGENLKDKHLTELGRILGYNTCGRLANSTYAYGGADAAHCCGNNAA